MLALPPPSSLPPPPVKPKRKRLWYGFGDTGNGGKRRRGPPATVFKTDYGLTSERTLVAARVYCLYCGRDTYVHREDVLYAVLHACCRMCRLPSLRFDAGAKPIFPRYAPNGRRFLYNRYEAEEPAPRRGKRLHRPKPIETEQPQQAVSTT